MEQKQVESRWIKVRVGKGQDRFAVRQQVVDEWREAGWMVAGRTLWSNKDREDTYFIVPFVRAEPERGEPESEPAPEKPSWEDAPDWAQWLTQDKDGWWKWHKQPPRQSAFADFWHSDGLVGFPVRGAPNPDWKDTLECRRPSEKPSWEDAPERARWLAQDEDGMWWWYAEKPQLHDDQYGGYWDSVGLTWTEKICRGSHNPNWQNTLEHRPLRPCPMCGSGDVRLVTWTGKRTRVQCMNCLLLIYGGDEEDAAQAWNRRAE